MLHKGDIGAEKWSVQSVKYDEEYLNKTAYNVVTKYYNYDGKLVRPKTRLLPSKSMQKRLKRLKKKRAIIIITMSPVIIMKKTAHHLLLPSNDGHVRNVVK